MGANCCVAAREKPLPDRGSRELSSYRNARHSPSWSFRWDNRTHIEDIMENPSRFSQHRSGHVGSESKSSGTTETEGLSDGGSPSLNIQPLKGQKEVGISGSSRSVNPDKFTRSKFTTEEKDPVTSSVKPSASDTKSSISTSSSSPSEVAEASSSRSCSLQSHPYPSRKTRRSDGSSAGGYHGGSSDSWSMRTFTKLVATSSNRERWSLDSDTSSSANTNISRSSFTSSDLNTCRVCSKLLEEKSPWSGQRIVSTNELPVGAVLICGHVYHADCLESITSETDRYDPPCPMCTKISFKAEVKTRSKVSRRAVADIDVDVDPLSSGPKQGGRGPFMRR
ncbi:suppressor protein SRP40-like, partial [Asparagus officinalis]